MRIAVKFFWVCMVLIVETSLVAGDGTYETSGIFPDVFSMEDYYGCVRSDGSSSYCTATLYLVPGDETSELWRRIEESSKPAYHFNRTWIYRTLCISSNYTDYNSKKSFLEDETNRELGVYNLNARMTKMDCMRDKNDFWAFNGRLVRVGLVLFTILTLFSTMYDQICEIKTKSKVNDWLLVFSITSNWKKSKNDKNTNPDFHRLKCIQGIRTYQNVLVILTHTIMMLGQKHVQNISHVEQFMNHYLFKALVTLMMFEIQTYFVISSWLLTNQILEIHRKNGRFSARDAALLFVHRISRFWLPLLFMIFVELEFYKDYGYGPGNFHVSNIFFDSCKKNWWATLFQLTNLSDIGEICNLGTWSLTLDTQFYLIYIALFYVVLNYKISLLKCLSTISAFVYLKVVSIYYQKELPFVTRVDLKNYLFEDMVQDEKFVISYFSFWLSAGSSLVGVLFGYIYFLTKEEAKVKPVEKICWICFTYFPPIAVFIGLMGASNKWMVVLVGPLLKPIFSFGIACGIYGISRNIIQGWPKRICENSVAVLLANFTFSAYVFHFWLIFSNGSSVTTPLELTVANIIIITGINVIKSFFVGIIGAVTVEQPGINIRKLILPKIKQNEQITKEKCT